MEIKNIAIKKPKEVNFILTQSHFIKTVEDVYETLVEAVAGIKFGLAFCEASGERKIRHAGTDDEMIKLAIENAKNVSAGHSLFIFLKKRLSGQCLKSAKKCLRNHKNFLRNSQSG